MNGFKESHVVKECHIVKEWCYIHYEPNKCKKIQFYLSMYLSLICDMEVSLCEMCGYTFNVTDSLYYNQFNKRINRLNSESHVIICSFLLLLTYILLHHLGQNMHHQALKSNLVDLGTDRKRVESQPLCPKPKKLSPSIPEFLKPIKCTKHRFDTIHVKHMFLTFG